MGVRVGLPLVVSAAVLGSTTLAHNQTVRDRRPFRSGIEVTSLTATVRDGQGRLVTGLGLEAFSVFEDGEPQTVTQFTNERVPISLGVLGYTSPHGADGQYHSIRVRVQGTDYKVRARNGYVVTPVDVR